MVRPPQPEEQLEVPLRRLHVLSAGTALHRVHKGEYRPENGKAIFNASAKGSARFSPLYEGTRIVPTLYAGLTLDCALMEPVFHDVSPRMGVTLHADRLEGMVLSTLRTSADLHLLDLTSVGLRQFNLENADLIDTLPIHYPVTQAWARALYAANPGAQGLFWTSRLDNRTQAMMIFGDRPGAADSLQPIGDVRSLQRASGGPVIEVLQLAEKIGVDIVM